VSLRPARPEPADAAAFAELADTAASGLFATLVGADRAPRFLASIFAEPACDLSWEHVTFAEQEGRIAGMLSAYSGRQHADEARRTRWAVVRHAGLRVVRMARMYWFLRAHLDFIDRVEPGDLYVQMVAVSPDFRGRGLGRQLMGRAADLAREQGCGRLALDVSGDNEPAIALYRSLGLDVVETSPEVDGDVVHRMVGPVPPSGTILGA